MVNDTTGFNRTTRTGSARPVDRAASALGSKQAAMARLFSAMLLDFRRPGGTSARPSSTNNDVAGGLVLDAELDQRSMMPIVPAVFRLLGKYKISNQVLRMPLYRLF